MDNLLLSVRDTGTISNYMLADVADCKRQYLMSNKNLEVLPYKLARIINTIQLKKSLELLSSFSGNLLITNEVLQYVDTELLEKIKCNGSRIILILIDPMSANYPSTANAKRIISQFKFDKIYSFDPDDSKQHGFIYTNSLYSMPIVNEKVPKEYDLYYCGNIKNRTGFIDSLQKETEKNKVSSFIRVFGYNANAIAPYETIVRELQKANCIFDITQENQAGVTLRFYEAVAYNKKLLTNNERIKQLPFYDENYMKCYKSINDIDWDWVKKEEKIDYNYDGRFSPNNNKFFKK